MNGNLDQLSINTIRTLAMDAVQKANSGHPGTPMALAPVAYALWQRLLRFDPDDPIWPNRDRFVLSNGHASMLLYSLLHLAEVKAVDPNYETLGQLSVTLDDIKNFRQLGSKCPGHPEYRITSGVETTTGPLGQGVGNSVGMALGRYWLAEYFNKPGYELFDYNVYAICGDGDMMEGVSGESASLAGHLKLSNLCWIYDNNHITIEGSTKLAFTEDVASRFMGYGWNVTRVGDANDLDLLTNALGCFLNTHDRPTLIIVDSHIGYGAPHKQDTREAHGEPLGEDEIRLAKRAYGWPEDAKFLVPDEVRANFRNGIGKRGKELHAGWEALFERYKKDFPDRADDLRRIQRRELPDGWDKGLPSFPADPKGLASRDSSAQVLNVVARNVPWLIGGAADLAPSTKTRLTFEGAGDFEAGSYGGRNLHFGIREHAMCSILNGLSLTKVRPFGAGFLIFSDYSRPPMRLAAIMEIPVIYVFTHDSIGVGEDGPTHQPVEQLASLRAVPGLIVLRPAIANPGPKQVRFCSGPGKRSLRARRCANWETGAHSDGHGKRSISLYQCVRATHCRGPQGPGSQHAVMGDFRTPDPGVPRERFARQRHAAHRRGASLYHGMGAVCRPCGPGHWHEDVRGFRSFERAVEEIWIHARRRGRCGAGDARKIICALPSPPITPATS